MSDTTDKVEPPRYLTVDDIIKSPDYPVNTRATWYRQYAPYIESYLFGGRRFWEPATVRAHFASLRQPPGPLRKVNEPARLDESSPKRERPAVHPTQRAKERLTKAKATKPKPTRGKRSSELRPST
jgi:hypothetical protein